MIKFGFPQQLLTAVAAVAVAILCLPSLQAEPARSCVWKIQNGVATVYIAGSVHLLRQTDHPLPPPYQTAYDASDRVYFEVDMQEMMKEQGDILKLSKLPDGVTIKDRVSEETYKKLKDYFKKRGIGGPMLETMKPGMLAMTVSSLEAVQFGALPQFGVEMHFDQQARKDKKPVAGLETTAFQVGLFDALDADEQDEMLAMTLEQVDETPEMLGKLIKVWKAGDAEKLNEQLNKYFEEGDKLTELLLYSRNANWIAPIEKELKSDGSSIFIVGAGHLVGNKSVIDLLEKKGYKAEQMTYEP